MKIADNQKELLRVLTKDGTLTDTFEKRKLVHENGIYHQEIAFIPVSRGGGRSCFNAEVKIKNLTQIAGLYVLGT